MSTSFYLEHLTSDELKCLARYKYRGEDRSLTYKYVMSPFYSWLIKFMPRWIAPNTITLIGFVLVVSAHILLMYHVPHFEEQAPRYVYLVGGAALFIYMVLDNLDGKQARRTNSSSPLGQLFDHGCDAMNVTLSGMSLLATCRLGPGWMSMSLLFFLGHVMVFGATLEEYHTGAMVLRELNGPNEGLLTLVALQLMTGVVGPQVWSLDVPAAWTGGLVVKLNEAVYWVAVLPTAHAVVGNAWGIAQWHRRCGKTGARAVAEVGRQFVGIAILGVAFNAWAIVAKSHFERQTVVILWLSGGLVFDLISRMMVAHLCKARFPYLPRAFVPMILCCANAILGERGREVMPVDELTLVVAVGTGVYNMWRVWCVVSQLCEFLNVRCFSLRPLRTSEKDST